MPWRTMTQNQATHEDQGGVQALIALLHEFAVTLIGFTSEFVAEFDMGAARGSKEVQKERRQCLEHCIF